MQQHPLASIAFFTALLQLAPAMAADPATPLDPKLQKTLAEEKEARKACKIKICRTLRKKDNSTGTIGCHIVKTMPKQDLDKIMAKGKLSWPYGHVNCTTDLDISRQKLIDSVNKPEHTMALKEHALSCTIKREPKEDYRVVVRVTPTIDFKNGKAVKAKLNWGKVEGPVLTRGAIWTATGLDNRLNVFGAKVVEVMNTFMTKKCDEVKDALK